jgi:hypothetical protein
MSFDDKTALIGGIAFILFAICVIVFIAGRADVGDHDPFDKTEVSEYLVEIEENQIQTRVAFAAALVIDTFIVLVLAAVTYNLFRDRSQLLAAIMFGALVANSALSGAADVVGIVLTFVADDFVNGGPANSVGGSASLEVGRVLGMTELMLTHVQITVFGTSQLALGALLAFAPAGAVNPPKILGWLCLLSGLAAIAAWSALAADVFFVLLVANSLGSLVFFVVLGGWLIVHRRLVPAI